MEETVAIATIDEISNGRVNRFLTEVARHSDNPDLVWQKSLMIADQVIKKLTDRQRVVPASPRPRPIRRSPTNCRRCRRCGRAAAASMKPQKRSRRSISKWIAAGPWNRRWVAD
jgi:hypothetical protein